MKLVEFSNGKYGLRGKWMLGWWFVDLYGSLKESHQLGDEGFSSFCTGNLPKVLEVRRQLEVRDTKLTYKVIS